MDKFVQTELEGAGVNVEETLRRFMNNEMLIDDKVSEKIC